MHQADICKQSNILCMTNDPSMAVTHNQKVLVNMTRMQLQDLVVLGGLIWISVTDRPMIARATTPVPHRSSRPLSGGRGGHQGDDLSDPSDGSSSNSTYRTHTRSTTTEKQLPCQLRRALTDETVDHREVGTDTNLGLSE
jgi:hypothetical protein